VAEVGRPDLAGREREMAGELYETLRSKLLKLSVTTHPSADWTLQPFGEVVGEEGGHQYLIHDRDTIFGARSPGARQPLPRRSHLRWASPNGENDLSDVSHVAFISAASIG